MAHDVLRVVDVVRLVVVLPGGREEAERAREREVSQADREPDLHHPTAPRRRYRAPANACRLHVRADSRQFSRPSPLWRSAHAGSWTIFPAMNSADSALAGES